MQWKEQVCNGAHLDSEQSHKPSTVIFSPPPKKKEAYHELIYCKGCLIG